MIVDKRSNIYDALIGGVEVEITVGIHEQEGGEEHNGLSNAELGSIHEFGSSDIPQRSFIRAYVDESQSGIDGFLTDACNRMLTGEDALAAAELVALQMESGVKERILARLKPDLSEATKAIRGDDAVPLVKSSQLLGSIRGKAKLK